MDKLKKPLQEESKGKAGKVVVVKQDVEILKPEKPAGNVVKAVVATD